MSVHLIYRNTELVALHVHDHDVVARALDPNTIRLDLTCEDDPNFLGHIYVTKANAKRVLLQLEAIDGVGEGDGS